jgi:ribose 5-phosphate isomerase A
MKNSDTEKKLAAKEAIKLIRPGHVVGIGTGSTANFATYELGDLVKKGLKITGVPTSVQTKELAISLGIPLQELETTTSIDITIDGADEFTEDLVLIKGGGGALFREKVVASLTKQEIIIADSSKKVEKIGKFKVPVEVATFALAYVSEQLKHMAKGFHVREKDGKRFLTDQSNCIIDVDFGLIDDPLSVSQELNNIEGIVCHGIFIDLAIKVIMGVGQETVCFAF